MFDSWLPESKDHLPLTWWKTHPVYLAAIIALVGVGSIILTSLLGTAGAHWLVYTYHNAFVEGRFWTLFTYVLFNIPDIWVVLGCYMLWNFGEALERHLGRRSFVKLLVLLWLTPPLLATLMGLVGFKGPMSFGMVFGMPFAAGIQMLEFGVFNAFAALYPRAKISMIVITIDAWQLAAIFNVIYALQHILVRDWPGLFILLGCIAVAWVFIRYETGALSLPSLPRRAPKTTRPAQKAAKAAPKSNTPTVDDILDKISHHGMQSLTAEERRILDKASEEMKRRAD
ncbi:rhomboid family intramembrane serine protease [Prosthecobacter vanneervenii]|uniref:Rhomboid family intramembrane serine protease n=1 Tax=Prosthecobacter vanneervenii TaxID=48466 RepID=A0A7W7YFB0_9BACT|nr:rhomboid family intramembrane serine protease [Prosthecobacter vanneervenii]MBB5034977.1 hypothetical protein [Prosthecobacter vanneervenii]